MNGMVSKSMDRFERFEGFQLPSLEENIPMVSLLIIMQEKAHH